MKNNRNIKRRGFTLVELLIVIVVIGVLSAMMMLSSTEAVSSARASNIVSNLRNLKTAALSLYTSSLDEVAKTGGTAPTIQNVMKYMNNETIDSNYTMAFNGSGSTYDAKSWYVVCNVTDDNVKKKLAARAKSVGLLKASNATGDSITITDPYAGATGDTYVCMKVR